MTGTVGQPEPTGRDEALVAADDASSPPAARGRAGRSPHWRMRAGQRLELVLADAPRVGGVGTELVDGDLLDDQRGEGLRRGRHAESA